MTSLLYATIYRYVHGHKPNVDALAELVRAVKDAQADRQSGRAGVAREKPVVSSGR